MLNGHLMVDPNLGDVLSYPKETMWSANNKFWKTDAYLLFSLFKIIILALLDYLLFYFYQHNIFLLFWIDFLQFSHFLLKNYKKICESIFYLFIGKFSSCLIMKHPTSKFCFFICVLLQKTFVFASCAKCFQNIVFFTLNLEGGAMLVQISKERKKMKKSNLCNVGRNLKRMKKMKKSSLTYKNLLKLDKSRQTI